MHVLIFSSSLLTSTSKSSLPGNPSYHSEAPEKSLRLICLGLVLLIEDLAVGDTATVSPQVTNIDNDTVLISLTFIIVISHFKYSENHTHIFTLCLS